MQLLRGNGDRDARKRAEEKQLAAQSFLSAHGRKLASAVDGGEMLFAPVGKAEM